MEAFAMDSQFSQIFFSFLIIMNPFTSMVYFLGISKGFSAREKAEAINSATYIAGVTLVIFLVLGPMLLSLLGVSISSFQVAGGIVLLVISVRFMLGNRLGNENNMSRDANIMIIGVPLITGPGVLTTTMMMVGAYGQTLTFVAAIAALAVVWLILKLSGSICRLLGEKGMEISARIMGLLLAAIAVEFIKKGVISIVAQGA
jgi:multiple antibiotic resistance protein